MVRVRQLYYNNQSVGDSALRVLILPVSGICALAQSYLILDATGETVFAAVSILWSIVLLIPFADLGIGAVLTSAVAKSQEPRRDQMLKLQIVSAIRLLSLSGLIVLFVGAIIGKLGVWEHLAPSYTNTVLNMDDATIALACCIAVGLPLSIWQRIMLGLGKNWAVVLLTACAAPVSLISVWAFIQAQSYALVGASPALASVTVGILGTLTLMRGQDVSIRAVVRNTVNFKSNRQVPLASVAAPMLVILIVQPLALQSDRLILGWRAPTEALADYAMATQLYLPALAVLSTGAASMWPRFAQAVNDPGLTRQLFRKDSLFLLMIATAMGIALIVAGPAICTVVSDGSIVPDRTLFGAFGILLLAQAVALPSAMMMTDGSGMLFQAAALTIMMLLKLSLTLTIAGTSSAGPVLASAIAILTCQYAPSRIFVGRTRLAEGQVRR